MYTLPYTAYRILQEQFTNILKHAKAKYASVKVTMEDHALKVTITDDGQSFDSARVRKGIGIENMMGRMEGLKGQLCLTSAPGSGSIPDFSIPLDESGEARKD